MTLTYEHLDTETDTDIFTLNANFLPLGRPRRDLLSSLQERGAGGECQGHYVLLQRSQRGALLRQQVPPPGKKRRGERCCSRPFIPPGSVLFVGVQLYVYVATW